MSYEHQENALALAEAFADHDKRLLNALSETDLNSQFDTRQHLFDHVDTIWQDAKRQGHAPAVNPELWNSVAGMRDLVSGLLQNVDVVRYNRANPDSPIG